MQIVQVCNERVYVKLVINVNKDLYVKKRRGLCRAERDVKTLQCGRRRYGVLELSCMRKEAIARQIKTAILFTVFVDFFNKNLSYTTAFLTENVHRLTLANIIKYTATKSFS